MRKALLNVSGLLALLALCPSAAGEAMRESTVFTSGTEGYSHFRIPAIVRATDGTLLAFAEGRKDSGRDEGNIDIVLKRSGDNGRTWGPMQIVADNDIHTIGNPTPIVDRRAGRIILLACQNQAEDHISQIVEGTSQDRRTAWMVSSDDHGATWSAKREISRQVMEDHWRWYAFGPCHGIQLQRGEQAGRLIAPANFSAARGKDNGAHIVYSDDGGENWHIGAITLIDSQADLRPSESTVVELVDGRILLNSRNRGEGVRHRAYAISSDGGETFTERGKARELVEPVCQGTMLRLFATDAGDPLNQLLFANPASTQRLRMTVRSSFDEGKSWDGGKLIHRGPSAYSDLVALDDGEAGVLYEHGWKRRYERINFAIFSAPWLADPTMLMLEFDGEVRDTRGNGLAVQVNGTPKFVAGDGRFGRGQAMQFGEASPVLRIRDTPHHPLDFEADDSFTIEALIRTTAHTDTSAESSGPIIAKDVAPGQPSYWLRVQNGRVRFLLGDGEKTTQVTARKPPVNDGRWHHIAAVRDADAGKVRLFVDYQQVSEEVDATTGGFGNDNDLVIGAFNDSKDGSKRFLGEIDFVRISGKALPPDQFVQPGK